MITQFFNFLRAVFPVQNLFAAIRQLFFGSAVKTTGKKALHKSPFSFNAPNLLVSVVVISVINILNFIVMFFLKDNFLAAVISSVAVTLVTAFFVVRGVPRRHALRERFALLALLLAFLGVFLVCVFIIDWWWLALVAKLTLEVLLCYAIMLSGKNKADSAQSKVVGFILKTLRISPEGRIGKWLVVGDEGKRSEACEPQAVRRGQRSEDGGTT